MGTCKLHGSFPFRQLLQRTDSFLKAFPPRCAGCFQLRPGCDQLCGHRPSADFHAVLFPFPLRQGMIKRDCEKVKLRGSLFCVEEGFFQLLEETFRNRRKGLTAVPDDVKRGFKCRFQRMEHKPAFFGSSCLSQISILAPVGLLWHN